MHFNIVTLFPDDFSSPLATPLIRKAIERGIVSFSFYNPREFATDKRRTVDGPPLGGGAGMVMSLPPLCSAVEKARKDSSSVPYVIMTTPQAKHLTQDTAKRLSVMECITIVCGHYSGIDERFIEHFTDESISIGDYILNGGELPAMVIINVIVRLLPGTVGNPASIIEDSLNSNGPYAFQAPLYTHPVEYRGLTVPPLLLSGNHKLIEQWRLQESRKRTYKYRYSELSE